MRSRSFAPLHTQVSELSLGTWSISGEGYGPVNPSDADAVVDRALELGINLFETSDAYNHGAMLSRFGERLPQDNVFVAVRFGIDRSGHPIKCFARQFLSDSIAKAAERLKRNRVDIALLHNPSASTIEQGEATGLLREMHSSGQIGAWGVSAGNATVALAALESGAQVISVAHNIFHFRDLHTISSEIAMRGVAVLAHSVLAYGLLAALWGPNQTFPEGDHRRFRWNQSTFYNRIQQLTIVRNLVSGDVLTPRAAALRFVLSNSLVTSAVIGPRNTSQLEQLAREAGSGPDYLPPDALTTVTSKLQSPGIYE